MRRWLEAARRVDNSAPKPTDKTDETDVTEVLSVSSVVPGGVAGETEPGATRGSHYVDAFTKRAAIGEPG